MNDWIDSFATWHAAHGHLLRASIAGVLVSVVCGVIGCFIILRRMAFLGDAIAHAMLAGVVGGYLFMKWAFQAEAHAPAMLLGSLLAGLATVAMIGFVTRVSRVKEDTAIGIMYTGIFALGGMLASYFSDWVHIDLLHFVVGSVLSVEMTDLWMLGGVCVFVLGVIVLFYRPLQMTSFDPVMAASIGIPVLGVQYLLTVCTSLVVVSAVNIVGVILVVGMLVTPAATAYLICERLHRMLWVSACFAVLSFAIGYFTSVAINVAPGSAIVVAGTAQYLLVLVFAPRHGLLSNYRRRRQQVPHELLEDVLACVLKAPKAEVPFDTVYEFVHASSDRVRSAVRALERDGLLTCSGETVSLTTAGEREARRLLRAHRLWETYLERLGTPSEELHRHAHRLEHLHQEEAVDYLDDKLGHPLLDPHGKEIPEDLVHLTTGSRVNVSLLREGWRGRIVELGPASAEFPLHCEMIVEMGPRQSNGELWQLHLPSRQSLLVNHEQADAIIVEVLAPPPP
ncbi:MAG: Manganese transport system rane protein MntB [Planctomycetota bacterium]